MCNGSRWKSENPPQIFVGNPFMKSCKHSTDGDCGITRERNGQLRWWGRNVTWKARTHQRQHQGLNQANCKNSNSNRTLNGNMKGQTDLKRETRSVGRRWGNAFPPAPAELTVPVSESVSGHGLRASGGSRPGAAEGLTQGNYHLLSTC